jgi:N-glycosylase/DNA lyase
MTSLVVGSSFRFCCRQLFTRTTRTETAFAARRRVAIFSSSSSMKNKSSIKRRNQNEENWKSLRTTRDDLSLDRTLPTGQSFRWQKVEEEYDDENDENQKYSTYVGVIGRRVVQIRERMEFEEEEEKSYETTIEFRVLNTNESNICKDEDKENGEEEEEQVTKDVRAYFNLDDPIPLKDLFEQFSKADPYRFGRLSAYVRGARTLRQPPAECLISFVCSSNNNIARIKKMVESLCEKYGEELVCNVSSGRSDRSSGGSAKDDEENEVNDKEEMNDSKIYHAFPTVEQLAEKCDEQTLRDLGFGYRAKFIPAMAKELVKRGGEAYLLKLRDAPQTEEEKCRAITELTSLPGVGPKVAGCAALFSLDKKSVVPVDTHVWQLAREHFDPNGELASMETTAATTKGNANEEEAEQQRHKESSTPTTPTKQKDKPLSITPKMMKKCEEMLVSIYGAYAGYAHTALFVAELPTVRESLPEHLRTPTKADKKRGEKNETKPEKKKRKVLVDGENKSDDDGA